MIEEVTFFLCWGGQRYTVAMSLLAKYPNSMLSKKAQRYLVEEYEQNKKRHLNLEKKNKGEEPDSPKATTMGIDGICNPSAGEDEIPLVGNGDMFQYVLEFLRDGSVIVPPDVSRDELMRELEFFEIQFDKDKIFQEGDEDRKIAAVPYYYDPTGRPNKRRRTRSV